MTVYGNNLVGDSKISSIVVCKENEKSAKKNKESNKAKALKEKIKKEKDLEQRTKDAAKLKELKKMFDKIYDKQELQKFYQTVEVSSDKIISAEIKQDFLLFKINIIDKICKGLIKGKSGLHEKDLHYVDELVVLIRDGLKYADLSDKQKTAISTVLSHIGFQELISFNNLPPSTSESSYTRENWIRYQLKRLGPQLERETGGVYDPDVGFTPDPWQEKLIFAIRKRQSALIVAPTSSGKTFASYYCMQQVLRESKDGIVVYVSPTKALVNQVAATVYARFQNINLPPGMAVVGVFTRDYK